MPGPSADSRTIGGVPTVLAPAPTDASSLLAIDESRRMSTLSAMPIGRSCGLTLFGCTKAAAFRAVNWLVSFY